jgi:threonylcarbamoyladenosine tRNA methylthiotransferase MtaB
MYKVFWCKVNKYYLNKWLAYFDSNDQDISHDLLIATCVVTDRAKNKWLKEVKLALENWQKVYITWCGVFDMWKKMEDKQFYAIYPELSDYKNLIELLWEEPGRGDAREVSSHEFKITNLYTKKFVMIQNGCDTHCTFCLTILKRGKNRSRDLEDIIMEINEFVAWGGKEIVLTGINLAARWSESTRKPDQSKFSELLHAIIKYTSVKRIRISSLWPEFLDDRFFELMKNSRFLPHFHFSIQSFSDKVLKLMNRNYDAELLDRVLTRIRTLERPDQEFISIGADIITWFPGETEEEFQKTIDGVKKYGITKLHAFPFSAHEKGETIPAAKLPDQVPFFQRKQKNAQLLSVADQLRGDFIEKNKWRSHQVLIEAKYKWKFHGWTENYIQIEFDWIYKRGDIIEHIL